MCSTDRPATDPARDGAHPDYWSVTVSVPFMPAA